MDDLVTTKRLVDLDSDRGYLLDGRYWVESAQSVRKKGKWVRDNIYEPESGFVNPLICSECKCKAVVDLYGEYVTSSFCPECGADMREE